MAEESARFDEALGRHASDDAPHDQEVWTSGEVAAALEAMLRGIKVNNVSAGKRWDSSSAYVGNKLRDDNVAVMVQVAEVADTVSEILRDAINGVVPLSVACRQHDMDYIRFRRFCEKFMQVRNGGRSEALNLPEYEATFEERFYALAFGVSAEGARSMMPDDAEETVDEILGSLTDKYRDILTRRVNGETLESIGADYDVSRERIRQIMSKLMRKLHNPAKARLLEIGRDAYNASEQKRREELDRVALQKSMIEEEERRLKSEEKQMWMKKPIEELEPSVRTYHCLKRADIDTVGELVELDSSSLMKIRNFGRKSYYEVVDKLHALGLCLRDEREEQRDCKHKAG